MRIIIALGLLAFCQISNANNRLIFPNSCAEGKSIVIAAVGDILLHPPLQAVGVKNGFETLWEEAIPYLKSADIAYGNLEGPIAAETSEQGSGYPTFNYPVSLAFALQRSGFDIVSTANNHVLDQQSSGVDTTLKWLDKLNIVHVGSRIKDSKQPLYYILFYKDFKIAWISCTEHTNEIDDTYKQVLYCYKKKDRVWILDKINELKNQVDAIIITPHWGEEYESSPNETQILFAHEVLNAGAIAVIGSHPHVLQPVQKYITKDGRATLIMYSLGNFVSYQGKPQTRSTIILLFGLKKNSKGTFINGVRFVPMYMENRINAKKIFLKRLTSNNDDKLASQIISHAVPTGNILYSKEIIINPECITQSGENTGRVFNSKLGYFFERDESSFTLIDVIQQKGIVSRAKY